MLICLSLNIRAYFKNTNKSINIACSTGENQSQYADTVVRESLRNSLCALSDDGFTPDWKVFVLL